MNLAMNFDFTKKYSIAKLAAATAVSVCTVLMSGEAKAVVIGNCGQNCVVYNDASNNQNYNITTVTGTDSNFTSQLQSQFWFNDPTKAGEIAQALFGNLSHVSPSWWAGSGASPFLVHTIDPTNVYWAQAYSSTQYSFAAWTTGQAVATFAVVQDTANSANVPEPSDLAGSLIASLAAGAGVVARRKLALGRKTESSSSSAPE
jgi:hypothetical protein